MFECSAKAVFVSLKHLKMEFLKNRNFWPDVYSDVLSVLHCEKTLWEKMKISEVIKWDRECQSQNEKGLNLDILRIKYVQ